MHKFGTFNGDFSNGFQCAEVYSNISIALQFKTNAFLRHFQMIGNGTGNIKADSEILCQQNMLHFAFCNGQGHMNRTAMKHNLLCIASTGPVGIQQNHPLVATAVKQMVLHLIRADNRNFVRMFSGGLATDGAAEGV